MLAISALYVRLGGLTWMRGAFYGIGAAVVAIIARSVHKLVKLTLAKDRLLWGIFALSAVVTAYTETEVVWLFVACGLASMLLKAPAKLGLGQRALSVAPLPLWMITGLLDPASSATLLRIAGYFAEAGAFVFGSGLAIVPFLRGGVVAQFHWLTDHQFLDAVAVAMITPGPVVITVAFIGYLVAGPVGAAVAGLATFGPCYLFTVIPAPHFRRFAKNQSVLGFIKGVTAAATGAIAGAAFVLGRRAIIDWQTVLIAATTFGLLTRFKKLQEPLIIVAAATLG